MFTVRQWQKTIFCIWTCETWEFIWFYSRFWSVSHLFSDKEEVLTDPVNFFVLVCNSILRWS